MTYAKLPGLTWDGTVYENEEMGTLEALLPTGGWPTAHAPAMVAVSYTHLFRSGTFSVLGSGFAAQADFYKSIRVLHNGWKILFR